MSLMFLMLLISIWLNAAFMYDRCKTLKIGVLLFIIMVICCHYITILTCSRFSSEHSIKVRCVDLPGQDRLAGHLHHVTVSIRAHGGSSCLAGLSRGLRLHQRRPVVLLAGHQLPGRVGGPIHGGGLVEERVIGAHRVELLAGVRHRAGPRQVELGARSPPHPDGIPGEGAHQTALVLLIGGSLRSRGPRRPRRPGYVRSLTFRCVWHWTATHRGGGRISHR